MLKASCSWRNRVYVKDLQDNSRMEEIFLSDDLKSDLALQPREWPYSITADHLTPPFSTFPSFTVPGNATQDTLSGRFSVLFTDWCSDVITNTATFGYTKEKESVSVWQAAVAWLGLARGIRVEYSGSLWMERPVFNLLDRGNKSKREVERREGARAREAGRWESAADRSFLWVQCLFSKGSAGGLICGPQRRGDLLDPAYCPFYHLSLLMSLSP